MNAIATTTEAPTLVIDDHPIVLQGCRRVLEDAGIERIIEATSVVAAYRSFLDSTGLGVLVGRLKAVRMLEGVMRVVITNPRVLRNFQITGLEKIFTIDSTAADAVAAVKAGA